MFITTRVGLAVSFFTVLSFPNIFAELDSQCVRGGHRNLPMAGHLPQGGEVVTPLDPETTNMVIAQDGTGSLPEAGLRGLPMGSSSRTQQRTIPASTKCSCANVQSLWGKFACFVAKIHRCNPFTFRGRGPQTLMSLGWEWQFAVPDGSFHLCFPHLGANYDSVCGRCEGDARPSLRYLVKYLLKQITKKEKKKTQVWSVIQVQFQKTCVYI